MNTVAVLVDRGQKVRSLDSSLACRKVEESAARAGGPYSNYSNPPNFASGLLSHRYVNALITCSYSSDSLLPSYEAGRVDAFTGGRRGFS